MGGGEFILINKKRSAFILIISEYIHEDSQPPTLHVVRIRCLVHASPPVDCL